MPMCCCVIGCQHSTLNRLFHCLFFWYDVITCKKVNKSLGAHLQALFSKIFLFFDVPQYANRFDYVKDRWQAVYFSNRKNYCISPVTFGPRFSSWQRWNERLTGVCMLCRYHLWPQGQAATNFTKWQTASEPYKVCRQFKSYAECHQLIKTGYHLIRLKWSTGIRWCKTIFRQELRAFRLAILV